jgi:hypothetical protein
MTDLLTKLLQRLDNNTSRYSQLDAYFAGSQALAYLSPQASKALGDRLRRVSVNIPALLVNAVAERLRVVGFDGADVWADWLGNDLDQTSPVAHREALVLGQSFVIVWANGDGTPNVSIESAKQVSILTDPGSRATIAAVKRWETETTTEAVLYQPDQITQMRANAKGATTAGFRTVETLANPLGQVPVVQLANRHRLLGDPVSEMADVLDLTDAVVKLTTDMLVTSEYGARPRRWAVGVELEEQDVLDDDGNPTGDTEIVNPIPEGSRAMVSENPEAKFGQLAGADLSNYENATGALMRQISAVSGLPPRVLGVAGDANPTSADSIRASEAALTARAEARARQFGRSWEQVARLMVAVRDGTDPAKVDARIRWADPSTRSEAAQADATVKLYVAGLLPASYALQRLGYSADEVTEIRRARRTDGLDAAAVNLRGLAL